MSRHPIRRIVRGRGVTCSYSRLRVTITPRSSDKALVIDANSVDHAGERPPSVRAVTLGCLSAAMRPVLAAALPNASVEEGRVVSYRYKRPSSGT